MKATNSKPLRIALISNAVFSITTATLMIANPTLIEELLGVHAPLLLRTVAIALFIFAADLIHQATRPRLATWRGLYASAGDVLWVIATGIFWVLFPHRLSAMGEAIALGIAAIVLSFAIAQWWAIGQAHQIPGTKRYRHCLLVAVDAPADALWRVISRLEDIHRYMPTLEKSFLQDGAKPGVGAVRVCQNQAGQQWAEECIAFEPGQSFEVRFLAEAPGFPFPATAMDGGWQVLPRANNHAAVMVWWELTPKPLCLAPLMLPILAAQVDRDFPAIIHRMAVDALNPQLSQPMATLRKAQLMPHLC